MKMKLSQYHGRDLDNCWLLVAETKVYGFGKVGSGELRA